MVMGTSPADFVWGHRHRYQDDWWDWCIECGAPITSGKVGTLDSGWAHDTCLARYSIRPTHRVKSCGPERLTNDETSSS